MYDDYQVGDDAWIFLSGHQGEKSKGKVIKVIDDLPGYSMKHYIIEFNTGIEPILECRSAIMMARNEKSPIGFWYLMADRIKG